MPSSILLLYQGCGGISSAFSKITLVYLGKGEYNKGKFMFSGGMNIW